MTDSYKFDDLEAPKPLPHEYHRQADFVTFEEANPDQPKRGTDLDGELDHVKRALDETQSRLQMLQADDGQMRAGVVRREALGAGLELGFDPPTDWAPGAVYSSEASVFHDRRLYLATAQHVAADVFQDDLDAGLWIVAVDFNAAGAEAAAARDLARQYALEAEDVAIEPGEFSALHYAAKAEEARADAERWAEEVEDTPVAVDPAAVTWAASTAYTAGHLGVPTTDNGFYYEVTTPGTTGTTEPTWPTTLDATVADGSVVWTTRAKYSALHHAANAAASETAAATSEANAASSATAAATSETNAAASETAAATSETNAASSETAAAASETKAGQWAEAAEDTAVETGQFSALHHAAKAKASADLAQDAVPAVQVDAVADLQAGSYAAGVTRIWLSGYYGVGTPGGGPLYRDADDTTTADNGGTVFVDADGVRWKRQLSGYIHVTWFGAVGDGVSDDTAAIQNANSFTAGDTYKTIFFPGGEYLISSTIDLLTGTVFLGEGTAAAFGGGGEGHPTKITKAGTMTTVGLTLGKRSGLSNIGVFADTAATGGGVQVKGNYVTIRDFTSNGHKGANGFGLKLDALSTDPETNFNVNGFYLENITTARNDGNGVDIGSDNITNSIVAGFPDWSTPPDCNAGVLNKLDSRDNGGDGLKITNCFFNTIIGVLAEINSGYGLFTEGTRDLTFVGGDYEESNTSGNIQDNGVANNFFGTTPANANFGSRSVRTTRTGSHFYNLSVDREASVTANQTGGVDTVLKLISENGGAVFGRGFSIDGYLPLDTGASLAAKIQILRDSNSDSSKIEFHTKVNASSPEAVMVLRRPGSGILVNLDGSLKLVTVGEVDSGGTGFRVLRVAN